MGVLVVGLGDFFFDMLNGSLVMIFFVIRYIDDSLLIIFLRYLLNVD